VVGSILRSCQWVFLQSKPEQNAMRRPEDLIMTAFDQSRSISNDHNHAGEVKYQTEPPTNTEVLVRRPYALSIPKYLHTRRFPQELVVRKDAWHLRIPPIEVSADTNRRPLFGQPRSIGPGWTLTGHVHPRAVTTTTLIHSGNGTGTIVCSPPPEGAVSHTINRMLITNKAQEAETISHMIKPVPSVQSGPIRHRSRPPEGSHIPHQLRSVPRTGRDCSDSTTQRPRGDNGPRCRTAANSRCEHTDQ
jgi:hypothetical protein